jgi:hypothetical protein
MREDVSPEMPLAGAAASAPREVPPVRAVASTGLAWLRRRLTGALAPRGVREAAPTWGEGLLLVCRKCERRAGGPSVRKSLKGALRALYGKPRRGAPVKLATVSCLKVCPRGKVCVVATGGGMGGEDRLLLVEPGADAAALLAALGHGGQAGQEGEGGQERAS